MMKTAFQKLVLKHKDKIYNQALFFTGDREDAADIAQDVLLKMWINFEDLKQKTITSWLIATTRNQCIDRCRKKREISAGSDNQPAPECPVLFDHMDGAANPETAAINQDLKSILHAAIQRLPENLRYVLILREIQQHEYKDIAVALDLPMSSVKSLLHRGRKLLLHILKTQSNVMDYLDPKCSKSILNRTGKSLVISQESFL